MEGDKNIKNIFFITSYQQKMINEYKIYINTKEQNEYFSIKEEIDGKEYYVFINKIEISLKEKVNQKFKIPIEIEEITSKKKNEYILEIEYNEKYCDFLIDYSIKTIKESFSFQLYWIKFLNWILRRQLINENISYNFRYYFFYKYLFEEKYDINKNNNYYMQLSQCFIEEIIKNKEVSINIQIILSILLCSLYEKEAFSLFFKLKIKIKKIDFSDNFYLISNDIFFSQIKDCLEKLKTKNIK